MVITQCETRLSVISCQRDAIGGLKHTTLRIIPGDLGSLGQVTLGHGHLGARRQWHRVGVGFASLDGCLEGLVHRRISGVLQRDLQRVVEVLRGLRQVTLNLLGHRERLVSVGVGDRTVTQHLRNRVYLFTGDVVGHGVRKLSSNITGSLSTLNAGRQQDDRRLIGGDLTERDRHLGGRALDLSSRTECAIGRVLVTAQALRGGRVGHEVGVSPRVLIDRVAVKAPAGVGGCLVDNGCTRHSRITRRQHDAPHDGFVLIAILRIGQVNPTVLLVAGFTGGTTRHLEITRDLSTDLDDVGLAPGAGIAGQPMRRDRAVPLRSGLDLVIKDDGHRPISGPGSAADGDIVVGVHRKGTRNVRAQNGLARRPIDDIRVVGEIVTGLHASLGLPRKFHSQIPPVPHGVNLMSRMINELSLVPVQCDLVAHIRHRCWTGRRVGVCRERRGDDLCDAKETQYQCTYGKKGTKVTVLQRNHRKLLSTGCATTSLHTPSV